MVSMADRLFISTWDCVYYFEREFVWMRSSAQIFTDNSANGMYKQLVAHSALATKQQNNWIFINFDANKSDDEHSLIAQTAFMLFTFAILQHNRFVVKNLLRFVCWHIFVNSNRGQAHGKGKEWLGAWNNNNRLMIPETQNNNQNNNNGRNVRCEPFSFIPSLQSEEFNRRNEHGEREKKSIV